MKLTKIHQLYTHRQYDREADRQWVDNSRRYFQMGLWIVSHVTWTWIYRCVGAHFTTSRICRCVSVFECKCSRVVLARMRLTVKIAYADKIWLAVIHHTVTFYCCICTRHSVQRTSTCEHLLMARATFSFSFSLSLSLCVFHYVSQIDDEVHGNHSSARNRHPNVSSSNSWCHVGYVAAAKRIYSEQF